MAFHGQLQIQCLLHKLFEKVDHYAASKHRKDLIFRPVRGIVLKVYHRFAAGERPGGDIEGAGIHGP